MKRDKEKRTCNLFRKKQNIKTKHRDKEIEEKNVILWFRERKKRTKTKRTMIDEKVSILFIQKKIKMKIIN